MRRRKFITLIGAAAAWPVIALGQQSERMRRIGLLTNLSPGDSEGRARDEAFITELQQLGWAEGTNLQIDRRFTDGDAGLATQFAQELVALAPDAILTTGSAGLVPLLQMTRTVPIVFTIVPDPVGAGFVDSLARPGGNATGFSNMEYSVAAKWLELLKQIAPRVRRAAVLRDAATSGIGQFAAIQSVAPS